MYFHLIGIKEKNWKQNDLNILLQWENEEFIRKFLSNWWVVIVSLEEFKEDVLSFGNIKIVTQYNNIGIEILLKGENLSDTLYSIASLWLNPKYINFIENPVNEVEVNNIIDSIIARIRKEEEIIQREKDIEEMKEQKKYEEKSISEWLKAINVEIERIWQVIKAWEWIIWWTELKHLDDYLNEMKKIRLWTNFNKMATLVIESHKLTQAAEEEIFKYHQNEKFLIFNSNKIKETAKLWPSRLSTSENIEVLLWPIAIHLRLLWRDFVDTFNKSSMNEIFRIVINLLEYLVLSWIIILSILWLISPILWFQNFSLYLLPALWWLALLLYLFNSLWLKWLTAKIIWFIILVLVYWRGLILLLNTFSI